MSNYSKNVQVTCDAAGFDFHISTSYAMFFITSICMNTIQLCNESHMEMYANTLQITSTVPQYEDLINSYCGASTTYLIDVIRSNAEFITGIMKHCVETQDAKALVFLHFNSDQNKPIWKLMTMATEAATKFLNLNMDKNDLKFRDFAAYNEEFAELMKKSDASVERGGL